MAMLNNYGKNNFQIKSHLKTIVHAYKIYIVSLYLLLLVAVL